MGQHQRQTSSQRWSPTPAGDVTQPSKLATRRLRNPKTRKRSNAIARARRVTFETYGWWNR